MGLEDLLAQSSKRGVRTMRRTWRGTVSSVGARPWILMWSNTRSPSRVVARDVLPASMHTLRSSLKSSTAADGIVRVHNFWRMSAHARRRVVHCYIAGSDLT